MKPLQTTALLGVARSEPGDADRVWLRADGAPFDREDGAADLVVAWRRSGTAPEHAEHGRSASGAWHCVLAGRSAAPTADAGGLANAFEAQGVDALERLGGPCVGVLWSARERKQIAFRPAGGQRPLYYAPLPRGFAFASDARSLAAHPEIGFAFDCAGAAQYLAFGFLLGPATLARGVRCLGPGARVESAGGALREVDAVFEPVAMPRDEAGCIERIDSALHEAVARAWDGAARPALCLSAGLDSRTLLAVAHRRGIPLRCVTNGIRGSVELRLARRMCDVVGAEHLETLLEQELVERILDNASLVAECSDGEGALQNVIMLEVGRSYRAAHALDRVIRGHGGELLKLSLAYDFALPPELARQQDGVAARDRIFGQLTAAARMAAGERALRGELADAFEHAPRAAFRAAWDGLAAASTDSGGRAGLLFLRAFNGRSTAAAMRSLRQSVDLAQPFLDEEFVRTLLSAPSALRLDSRLQLELIRRNSPRLLRVPDSRVRAPLDASPLRRRVTDLAYRVARRFGAGRVDVPEKWLLARLDRFFAGILGEERSLSRPHVDPEGLRALLARAGADGPRSRTLLGRLTMLELHLRSMERVRP